MSRARGLISTAAARAVRVAIAVPASAVVVASVAAPAVAAVAAAPAPVPCSAIAGGRYDCQFYPAGDGYSAGAPVQASDATQVGYLNHGTNWITCQAAGGTEISGSDENDWWGYTEANDGRWGWVNAVWAAGGDNFGQYAGVPACAASTGLPPGAGQGSPSSGATVTPPPPPISGARRHLRVKLQLDWRVATHRTRVLRARFTQLPARVEVRLGCRGRRCPFRTRTTGPGQAQRALARAFTSGDVLRVTITAAGYVPEVAELRFRTGAGPSGGILSR